MTSVHAEKTENGHDSTTTADETKTVGAFEILRTNVKGYKGEIALAPKLCLHGDNQSGKSSLIEAIRLVLSKRAPREIGELCPDTADQLFVSLDGPAGTAKFTSERTKTGWSRPQWEHHFPSLEDEDLQHMVPTVSMGNLLALGPDLTREAIFARFGNLQKGQIPIPPALSQDQKLIWEEGLRSCSQSDDPAEKLTAMRQWLAARKRQRNAEIKVLDERKKTLAKQLSQRAAGTERLSSLRTQIEKARAWESLASVRTSLTHEQGQLTAIEADARALLDRKQTLATHEQEVDTKLATIDAQLSTLRIDEGAVEAKLQQLSSGLNTVTVLDDILVKMTAANVHKCPLCATSVDPEALRQTLAQKLEARCAASKTVEHELANVRGRIAAALQQRQSLDAQRNQLQTQYNYDRDTIKRRHEMALGRIASLQSSLAQFENTSYEGPSAAELHAEITEIEACEHDKTHLASLIEDLRIRENESAALKILEGQAKQLLKDLLVHVSDEAEKGVNKYMVPPFRAALDLEKNVWRVVGSDGKPHTKTSMCGSETSALTLALAQAWTDGSPLRVLLLDDDEIAKFSPGNLRKLLVSIDESMKAGTITQTIIATTRPHEIPDDWTKINMDTKSK